MINDWFGCVFVLYLINLIWKYHLISILSPASTLLEELLSANRKVVDLSRISMLLNKVAYVKCQEANICSKSNNKGTNEGSSLVTPPIGIECVYHLSLLGVGTNSNFFGRI